MPKKEFNSYKVHLTHGVWSEAQILCYKNNVYQGIITFMSGTINEPTINANGTLSLYYPYNKFEDIYTLCREESPVYIEVWGTTDKYCRVTTAAEPVGEEEGN
ncbi:hypothetical protein G5B37_04585 [Rasiella rasia]|uniref:Uncharacterized protein n=1 Tax=Rasiella rasia TaxID=2744027 RepID=A0A6G6GJY4_9FLAO|nr:hypothetical protein [Rasiella rasia]QIE58862.1 hypothetical protein G5B37_04585 [Rasiella rasia]